MKRLSAVLVFNPEVTEEVAVKILNSIKHCLELPTYGYDVVETDEIFEVVSREGEKISKPICETVERPFEMKDAVMEFDDVDGRPVFYVP
jgi:hypothetical protein